MTKKFMIGTSPHITSANTTRRIMLDVIIAMVPMMAASIIFFGWNVLLLLVTGVISAFLAEFIFDIVKAKKLDTQTILSLSVWDLSCVVTGILVALNVPYNFDLWKVALGSVFAIVIVKMAFGGIGKNFANPALTARILLVVAFAKTFQTTGTANLIGLTDIDLELTSGATWLGTKLPQEVAANWMQMLIGLKGTAAVGETSAIAILLGFVYLAARKVIDIRIPLIIVGGVAVLSVFTDGIPYAVANNAGIAEILQLTAGHVLSGGLLMGAVFMATDYSSSPNTTLGTIIYSAGIAILIAIIRKFSSMPEGVSFAILIMNITVPLIDKYIVPRPFGLMRAAKKVPAKEKA